MKRSEHILEQPVQGRKSGGFTLVELAVVVVIIGVLAAFAVPRFMNSVERSKAAEAFNYLSTVHSAMERYHARQGTYADDITKLDTSLTIPEYFTPGLVTAANTLENDWSLTLTRTGTAAGKGAYTVIFTQDGFDVLNSTIPIEVNPFQNAP